MRKSSIGIKEIAEAVGVSIMTVSRALRGVEGVSAEMRSEIPRTAKVMDYRPNRNARSLATSNSALIGISLPTLFSDVFPEILDGMRRTLDHAGFDTVIDTTDYNQERESDWIERMLDWNAAGLVLSGVDHAPELRARLRELSIPTLEIWDVSDDPIDICVGVDHYQAGVSLGQYLVECGYCRPAFVGVPEGRDRRADKRLAGLQSAFAAVGVHHVLTRRIDMRAAFEAGSLATKALLVEAARSPDVICYLNDHMAFGGFSACNKHGLAVPESIGIVGFNGLEINSVLPSPITTMITQRHQMGVTGARNLVARIHSVNVERSVVIPTLLSPGRTTSDVVSVKRIQKAK